MFRIIVLLGYFWAISSVIAEVIPSPHGVLPHQKLIDESPKPYQFSYQAEAIGGGSTRQETADGSGTVVGTYSLSDDDGRKRVVEYLADDTGFRASVKTNEPGTKNESPADVPTVSEASDVAATGVVPSYKAPLHYGAYDGYRYGGSLGYRHPYHYGSGLGYRHPYNYGSGLGYRAAYGYGRGYPYHYGGGHYGGLGYGSSGRYGSSGYRYPHYYGNYAGYGSLGYRSPYNRYGGFYGGYAGRYGDLGYGGLYGHSGRYGIHDYHHSPYGRYDYDGYMKKSSALKI